MTDKNTYFIKKGLSEPRVGLRDQGIVSFGLARKYANDLAAYNWTESDTTEGENLTEVPGTKIAVQAESRISSKEATSSEQAVKSAAKELIGKIRIGADLVLAKQEVPNVTSQTGLLGAIGDTGNRRYYRNSTKTFLTEQESRRRNRKRKSRTVSEEGDCS